MAFMIKQGDNLPKIRFQLFKADGVTPLPLTGSDVIRIAIRSSEMKDLLFKRNCTMLDIPQALGEYVWQAGDTDTPGDYQYEFEVTYANGSVQTIPVDGYFALTIVDDIA